MLMASRRRSRGFTLVEMMVAMVLGIILTGAVTGLVVSTMSTTNSTVQNMRVTEESRAITEIMTRELRRVRYDANALSRVGSGSTGTTFAAITPTTVNVASDCIKYSYDENGNGADRLFHFLFPLVCRPMGLHSTAAAPALGGMFM